MKSNNNAKVIWGCINRRTEEWDNRRVAQFEVLLFPRSALPQSRVELFAFNGQKSIYYQLGGVYRTLKNCTGTEGL